MTAASPLRIGVVIFPGVNTDGDTHHALETFPGVSAECLWHKDPDLKDVDGIVIPGGFSYGDYLRCGAIARFSPIMQPIIDFAAEGGLVMGICNGFQVLVEAGLLPGGLIRNVGLKFVCRYVNLRVETADTPFTSRCDEGDVLRIVIKHNEGNYTVAPETLARMRDNGQIVVRYVNAAGERAEGANPTGSLDDIAGVCNETHNVFGLMPHPENSVEAGLAGGADGRVFFQSMIDTLRSAEVRA
ncbi:MAG TPA: phosphoribosylformylglycinamidine synthase subunit PurQ [Thermoleophilia bacterium]|jgi:phosphoribosylformylglycinamidine synthase|nr:phosphoribosylformylglycinamidine synthase subunit PurQ [Acidobacteriota bacterium]HQF53334.1 phosphoribosylformylglycinamidine synthase subunit PurQ [Thermoleophilia bacterium]